MHPTSDREKDPRLSRSHIIHRSVFLDNNPPKPSNPFVKNAPTPASISRNNTYTPWCIIVVNNSHRPHQIQKGAQRRTENANTHLQCPLGLRLLAHDEKLLCPCSPPKKGLTRVPQITSAPLCTILLPSAILGFAPLTGFLSLRVSQQGRTSECATCSSPLTTPKYLPPRSKRPHRLVAQGLANQETNRCLMKKTEQIYRGVWEIQ
jgi:hypothetical protein